MPESVLSRLARSTELSKTDRKPPERCVQSSAGPQLVRIRLSSKPFKHIVWLRPCQREHPTEFPPDFHNGNRPGWRIGQLSEASKWQSVKAKPCKPLTQWNLPLVCSTRRYAFRSWGCAISAHAPKQKVRKLRKELNFWRSLP